eukprot:7287030-Pyramimonas_sp.AAC.1
MLLGRGAQDGRLGLDLGLLRRLIALLRWRLPLGLLRLPLGLNRRGLLLHGMRLRRGFLGRCAGLLFIDLGLFFFLLRRLVIIFVVPV